MSDRSRALLHIYFVIYTIGRGAISVEEDYTLLDYIQMARLKYYLGELSCKIYSVKEDAALHYGSALHLLEKGGLDLSLKKWIELVSLRMEE